MHRPTRPGTALRLARGFLALGVVATVAAPTTAAAGEIIVSGRLSRAVLNPDASPAGRGAVTLTIAADRLSMTYRITYAGIVRPVTAVHFCGGSIPREFPISLTCAFAIPEVAGGSSPITGKVPVVPQQVDVLASGYAVIELASAAGPEISGYIAIGPALPDTSTLPSAMRRTVPDAWTLLPVAVGALTVTCLAWLLRPAGPPRRR